MRYLDSYGESIVEVLIVLVVLGSALTTSFIITQRATSTNRTSLERTAATSFAQTQLEQMQSILLPTGNSVQRANIASYTNFCVDNSNTVQNVSDITAPQCKDATNLYNAYVSKDAQGNYTVHVFWDSLGSGQNKVNLVYKPFVSILTPIYRESRNV